MMPALAGGGGLVGIVVLLLSVLSGGGGSTGLQLGEPNTDLSSRCQTGDDANQHDDCRIVGVVNSVQRFWSSTLPEYQQADTVFFTGQVNTGCGFASSAVGPFYCPTDATIYIDLGFYDDLRQRFGAQGGPFAEAYVIAHEYGHHVENLQGVLGKSHDGSSGPTSSSVRTELMADCYAGLWANDAIETGFIAELTDVDIRDGLDAAAAIGDDRIQETSGGRVEPESWTHGSSEMRQRWFLQGYRGGTTEACDTFAAEVL
jgi:uncharacterized protein